tara:strand:- start:270 stop:455 length:186 start_codon:yes stop_codon:yes gene_type:complete
LIKNSGEKNMLNSASPIYEVIIGTTCLLMAVGTAVSIPLLVGLYLDKKEEVLRRNKDPQSS